MKKLIILVITLICLLTTSCNTSTTKLEEYYNKNIENAQSMYKTFFGAQDLTGIYYKKEQLAETEYASCLSCVAYKIIYNYQEFIRYSIWEFETEAEAEAFLNTMNYKYGYLGYQSYDCFVYENCVPNYYLLDNIIDVDGLLLSKDYKNFIGIKDMEQTLSKENPIDLILPESIETIAGFALNSTNNSNLELNGIRKVVCNEKLKVIGNQVFMNFNGIEEIILNEGLEYIHTASFYFIRSKQKIKIVIPKSIKGIQDTAFYNCELFFNITKEDKLFNNDINLGKNLNIYYKGMWEYNEEGLPVVIEIKA